MINAAPKTPSETIRYIVSGLDPVVILIVIAVVVVAMWLIFRRATQWQQLSPATIVLTVTLLSMIAFGVRVAPEGAGVHLNVPELAAIFVLFFLSELTIQLTSRIERVVAVTRSVEADVSSIRREILDGELVSVAKTLATTLPIVALVKRLESYELERVTLDYIVKQNTTAWVSAIETAMHERGGDSVQAECWRVLVQRYMNEELADLQNKLDIGSVKYPNPQIATNDRMYLDMLRELAKAASREPFLKPGREVQFLAITHLLPEWFFNWRHPDGAYAFTAIDGFRSAVVDIVQSGRNGARLRYRRVCLITTDTGIHAEHSIPFKGDLLNQYDKVLLTLNRLPSPAEAGDPCEATVVAMLHNAFPAVQSFETPAGHAAHLIVTREELNNHIVPTAAANNTNGVVSYTLKLNNGRVLTLFEQNLVDRYISTMHSAELDAEVGAVRVGELKELPNVADHDMLMVGYTEGGRTEWEFALSTNMRPGHETMLLHLVHDRELLSRIARFHDGLQRAPLRDRAAVTQLV